ncbi:MAG: DUF1289 domain-containing protein [Rhodobacteraceae bacterium]|nr:DUF1289 domain-containing protein [Paracoccaceae bacterium]
MDDLWQRDEIDSPCVKICVIDTVAGICIGCNRTRQEIAGWSEMTSEQRVKILGVLPERAGLLQKKRRGGRKARQKQPES